MIRRQIGWIGALCLAVGCGAEGAKPKEDLDPITAAPDAGPDGSTPQGDELDAASPEGGDGDGDQTPGDGDQAPGDGDQAPGDGDAEPLDSGTGDLGNGEGDGGASDDGADAAVEADGGVSYEAFCSGQGPVIKVPVGASDELTGGTGDVCTGTIARKVFKNALCACESGYFAGYLQTADYVENDDGSISWRSGGSVGINGGYYAGSYTQVGGDLRIFGAPRNAEFSGHLQNWVAGDVEVWGDLEIASDIVMAGLLTVAEDARVNKMTLMGLSAVQGTLTTPPYTWPLDPITTLGLNLNDFTYGGRKQEVLELNPPCACGAKNQLDVAAIVAEAETNNDNANPAVNLDPFAFSKLDLTVGAARITLPCGRFYLDSITGVGAVQLRITGRTALFVRGDVGTVGAFDVELVGPGAELDLFVGGNFVQTGYSPFGDPNRPEDIRVFVAGSQTIVLTGYSPFSGNLYAPNANIDIKGFLDMNGALFAKNFHADGYVKINYDSAILDQGDDEACHPPAPPPPPDEPPPAEPPPPECVDACDESCSSATTCVSGTCKPCSNDSDCCAPLICYEELGRCGARVK